MHWQLLIHCFTCEIIPCFFMLCSTICMALMSLFFLQYSYSWICSFSILWANLDPNPSSLSKRNMLAGCFPKCYWGSAQLWASSGKKECKKTCVFYAYLLLCICDISDYLVIPGYFFYNFPSQFLQARKVARKCMGFFYLSLFLCYLSCVHIQDSILFS